MQKPFNSELFAPLSTQSASQTQGGCYYDSYRSYPVRVVYRVPVYYAYSSYGYGYGSGSGSGRGINVTNPNIDDGAIVNF